MATVDTVRYEVVLAESLSDPGLVICLPRHKTMVEAATRRDDMIRRLNAGEFVSSEVSGKTFLLRPVDSSETVSGSTGPELLASLVTEKAAPDVYIKDGASSYKKVGSAPAADIMKIVA